MLVLIATPTREFVARQREVRALWTIAERKQRSIVAQLKQHELGLLLSLRFSPSKNIGKERLP
jgi:hypothetical protein